MGGGNGNGTQLWLVRPVLDGVWFRVSLQADTSGSRISHETG